ncbi:hypothetical protein Plec18170_009479 [Paecilomyces lecythidis]
MALNLSVVNDGDSFSYTESEFLYYRFYVPDVQAALGYILPVVADALRHLPSWIVDDDTHRIYLTGGKNVAERSDVMKKTVFALRDTRKFDILSRWRNETFPVYGPQKEILFHLERSACPLFGVVTYGVHAVAFVPPQTESDELKIWVSRRAKTKQTYGGMLDCTAAGGVSSGETSLETLVKECQEEASLSPDYVWKHATAGGIVTHFYVRDKRAGGEAGFLQPEGQYVYDIPLPPHIICKNQDGEVDEFFLWTAVEIRRALINREFKPNSALVMLDFLIRHGVLTPENEPDYIEIVSRLHRRLSFPLR